MFMWNFILIFNVLFRYFVEMLDFNNVIIFNGLVNSFSYYIFFLDEERSRLYVGAKDYIFLFNLVNIKDF